MVDIGPRSAGTADEGMDVMSNRILVAPVVYVVALCLALWFWRGQTTLDVLGLPVPLAVVWFGALGGVIASLQGIFFHNKNWDDSFTIWHVFSALIGVAFGLASYLFLLVIVGAADGVSASSAAIDSSAKGHASPQTAAPVAVYALGAFALGYGQREFHSMMTRVLGVMFQPPDAPKKPDPK